VSPASAPAGGGPHGGTRRRLPPGLAIIAAYLLLLVSSRLAYSGFFAGHNIENLFRQNVALGLLGIGMAFVIIGGNFDLSAGSILGLAGVLYALTAQHHPGLLAWLVALGAGVGCGVCNAVVVARFRVNSFMATFATGIIIGGIALRYQGPSEVQVTGASAGWIGTADWGGVPVVILLLAVVFAVGAIMLDRTRFGQNVHAVGDNAEAARLAGIPVRLVRSLTFVISGLLAGLAGIVLTAQVGVGAANSGTNLTLNAIAVVIVGGIAAVGGEGAMWRAGLGLLILATLQNVFAALSWSTQAQEIAIGLVILAALGADRLGQDRRRRAYPADTPEPDGPPRLTAS
jgi:ribose transport system permease protein